MPSTSSISEEQPSGFSQTAATPDGREAVETVEDVIDDAIPTCGYEMMPMVGLGGSAGSLPALQAFFKTMPPDSGMAFVVILHLSPDHESSMPAILARCTAMRVMHPVDGTSAEANTVYVIPPGKHLTSQDGKFKLTDLEPERGKRVAVDLFFRTLADTHGPHAVAIILSGADGDGASGLKRIKERGGLTIAQDPASAEVADMPQTAIHTGMVDWVLRPEEMPRWLMDYQARERRMRIPTEKGLLPEPPQKAAAGDDETLLREVLAFLRSRTGRDFMCYKRATIVRRIARRMQINAVDDLAGYLAFLRLHPGEAGALLQDLLISVTNFFRDREAFEALEKRMPQIFKGKGPGDAVRIWVPACATGEEAYSLAMLALEYARTLDAPPAIQVFGCDLDEAAIQVARAGVYADAITVDVSEERLRRFFVKEHRGYHVRREVREVVLFAAHDLLKDAPFSRMDLISCRNLLIYLNREAQERVLKIFHFALRPEALLFLGTTESVPEDNTQFAVVEKKHRIYAHRGVPRTGTPGPATSGTLLRTLEAERKSQTSSSPVLPERSFSQGFGALAAEVARNEEKLSLGELHFKLVERLAPPSMLVDKDYNIVHLSPNAGRYLQLAGGEPTTHLLRLVHPALRVELRTALFQATETNAPVTVSGVSVDFEGVIHAVDIRVVPAHEMAPDYLLVILEMREAVSPAELQQPRLEEPEPMIRRLEREAEALKTRLRDTVEQYEGSCEELKASNEELQAMNEELRSASEELETSREELQSINEELSTVNQELKSNLDELSHANSDMRNLMASTAIATLFLDREFRIMRFTPSAVSLFRLIPSDVGRPLADLNHQLDYPGLRADVEKVLEDLVPIEREVRDITPYARCYLARLLPYRTLDDHIGGVVLTLVDVTEVRRATEALAVDLEDTRQLQRISMQLIPEGNVQSLYNGILDAAMSVMRSDMASLQIFDGEKQDLHLLAHRGLHPSSAEFWTHVDAASCSACGIAISSRQRTVTPDVEESAIVAGSHDLEHYRLSGIRAVQSTPLICREGRMVGMISTHWRQPHTPGERELRLLDVLARQAADLIERKHSEEGLRASEMRQAFLLKLGDELRGICCTETIENTALEAAARELQAEAAFACAVSPGEGVFVTRHWEADGMPLAANLEAEIFTPDVLAGLAEGRTQVLSGAKAFVCVPLLSRGALTQLFTVLSRQNREWSPHEVQLVEETARRTWDAMERAHAEEALRASEEKYRTLFSSLDEGVLTVEIVFDENGEVCDQRYVEANPALTRMTSLGLDVIGKTDSQVRSTLEPFWLQTCGRVVRTGESVVLEHSVKSLAGNWLEVRCSRVGGEGSRTVVIVFNNITARKQAELALRASEARQSFLLKLSDALREEADPAHIQFKAACVLGERLNADRVGYAETHEDGEQIVVTRNYTHGVNAIEGTYRSEMFGREYLRQFLSGDPVVRNDIAQDPTLSEKEKQMHAAAQIGAAVKIPLVKGGSLVAVLFVHYKDAHEWTQMELSLIKDVAERTWAAAERARAEARLAQSLREKEAAHLEVKAAAQAKDHFLAVLSHELRTPLTPVTMALELLETADDLSAENRELLQTIQRNVENEIGLIDDLLDVTRISRGKLEVNLQPGDLHETLREAVQVCVPATQAKGQEVKLRCEAPRHRLPIDSMRLRQAFWNLLKNACKFSPRGAEIIVTTHNDHDTLVIEVTDSGIGMDEEMIRRVFQPFEQGSASITREHGGLGLGLAISKAIIEAHGGTLEAKSAGPGHGSTFTTVLPLRSPL